MSGRSRVDTALARYLARLTLRSPLSAQEQVAILDLANMAKCVVVERDFVRVGDTIDHACLIVDGLVARFAQIRNGTRSFVALHIPGDMADLHSVVAPKVAWALHALCPTTILRIPHQSLRDLVERFPAIATAFWRDCVVDANILAQWAVNLSRRDAVGRVAHLFCELAVRYRAIGMGDGLEYPLPITQADLADALGLTSVHLNRVLKRLGESGLMVKQSAVVRIADWDRLAGLAEFDPAYLELDRDTRDETS